MGDSAAAFISHMLKCCYETTYSLTKLWCLIVLTFLEKKLLVWSKQVYQPWDSWASSCMLATGWVFSCHHQPMHSCCCCATVATLHPHQTDRHTPDWCIMHSWHFPHNVQSRVYVKVWCLSICISVQSWEQKSNFDTTRLQASRL